MQLEIKFHYFCRNEFNNSMINMEKLKIKILCLTLILSVTGLFAQTPVNLQDPLPLDKDVVYGKLDNGMTYYIRHNENPKNRAELNLAVGAGSIMEDDDQQGLAHFCEHMAFNGTKNFPKHELISYLESIGMKFGAEVNAYTSFDETVYGITVPLENPEFLDKGILVLYDWAFNVSFEGEEIDKERGIIHEEWRMNQGAQYRMMQKMIPALFKGSKYANRLPVGLMSVIDSCEHETLRKFYRDWYRPELMALIIVGDFDVKVVEEKIKKLFNDHPKTVNGRPATYPEIPDHAEPVVEITTDKEAPGATVQMYYKHPMFIKKTVEDYKTGIAHSLYNSMLNKRLTEMTLQPDPPFMYGVGAFTNFLGPKSVFMSIAATTNEKLTRGMEAIVVENERVKRHGFTATELEREKKALLREIEKQFKEKDKLESIKYVEEYKANFLISKEPAPGIDYEYNLYQQLMPTITLEDVNKFAAQWITDENLVVIISAPEKEGVALPTKDEVLKLLTEVKTRKIDAYVDKVIDKPLIAQKPVATKVEAKEKNKELAFEKWTLKNGVKVVIKQTNFKDDEIQMSAFSFGGTSLYSDKDEVSASIAADVIMEAGVGEFDKIELDKYLSDKSVSVYPYIDEIEEGLKGTCSVNDFETMLQLAHLYITKPRKSQTAFDAYVERMKGYYQNRAENPEENFRDTLQCVLAQYHPRRLPMNEEKLKEADLSKAFKIYKERFGDPSGFTFYFVGNIDLKTAKPLIETYLGGLPVASRTETFKDLNIRTPKGVVKKEVLKGKEPKAVVFMDINGDMPWEYKTRLEIKALGEVLSTKLLESIREDKSGVYSIGAYPQMNHYPVQTYAFMVYFGCSPENVEPLTKGVFVEIDKLISDGPSDVDLGKVKEKLLRERETSLRENDFWLTQLKGFDFHGDKTDEFLKYETIVKEMSIESLKAAAQKYLKYDNYVRVVLKPAN